MKICKEEFYSCMCCLLKDHEGPHICSCDGSWLNEEIFKFPNPFKNIMEVECENDN